MQIRALKLKDRHYGNQWEKEVEHHWNYKDFLASPEWRKDWISFDGVVCHPSGLVYCGLTSFDGDIFKAYDGRKGAFLDLGFGRVSNPYDAKFHRSMALSRDGRYLYTATALLHEIDRYEAAPGGGIFCHDTRTGETEKLGIPIPHNYIQSIALDEARGVVYCMHFTPERLSIFNLETRQTRDLGPISSGMAIAQGENLELDDDGNAWCSWNATRAWQSSPGPDTNRLCRYDVAQKRIVFYDHGLPRADKGHGFAKLEGLFNLSTGLMYASGGNGSLYRIDPKTAQAELLGTPVEDRRSRLTSLVLHPDGYAYGVTGRDGKCCLLRFDPRTEKYDVGDAIVDADGVAMWQCHDIDVDANGVLYAGENDHPERSSYLWEIKLDKST
jgi:hypothetical protein